MNIVKMKLAFVALVLLCSVQCFWCKEGVLYKFKRMACSDFNTKFVFNSTCRVRHINRTTQLINWEANIQPNVSLSNIRAEYVTYYQFGTVYRPTLVRLSEFLCDAIDNKLFSHAINIIRSSYEKYSNLLDPCPKTGKLYIKNMLFDTSNFPQFVPPGQYRLDTKYFTYMSGSEEFILLSQDFIEVTPLGAKQF